MNLIFGLLQSEQQTNGCHWKVINAFLETLFLRSLHCLDKASWKIREPTDGGKAQTVPASPEH
jgi:hypothetical protein